MSVQCCVKTHFSTQKGSESLGGIVSGFEKKFLLGKRRTDVARVRGDRLKAMPIPDENVIGAMPAPDGKDRKPQSPRRTASDFTELTAR